MFADLLQTPSERPPWLWPRAAYVHIPFCAHHCGYCDFAVVAGLDHRIDRYLEALAVELSTLGAPQPVQTLFLGGGTPTHLGPAQLERLLTDVRRWLPLLPGGEFSVEANPSSLDAAKIALLAAFGVSRVSLGAQSFRPDLLRFLERDHQADDVRRAVEMVRQQGIQVSLDLIFGVPGQTPADWEADLRVALSLEPGHLSTYGLTYEKGTRLWKERRRGAVRPVDEEVEREQYERAMDVLGAAGLEHYEISSFARPGQRCRHNQAYWANEAYFGFGMGAARYVQGTRELNTRNLETFLRRVLAGQSATMQGETLAPAERAWETLALQLRRVEGILRGPFRRQTSFDVDALAGAAVVRLAGMGFLFADHTQVCLTRAGKCVADAVLCELLKIPALTGE